LKLIKQVPFRETHHISGRAVALAEQESITLADLSLDQLRSLSDLFEDDVRGVFDFENSVEKRNAVGGPAKSAMAEQIKYLRSAIKAF
jgi:argininosuccinate lyase